MNEKLDLVEILKDCPDGIELYSPAFGVVKLQKTHKGFTDYPISVRTEGDTYECFTSDGKYVKYASQGECLLFPSKDQRDWSKFKTLIKKFDYSTLKPFDKVLVRDADRDIWRCNSFTCFDDDQMVCDERWQQGIPYNEETKHLAGTTDMPDEKYIWWDE